MVTAKCIFSFHPNSVVNVTRNALLSKHWIVTRQLKVAEIILSNSNGDDYLVGKITYINLALLKLTVAEV